MWPDDCKVLPAPARPPAAHYAIDDVTHRWFDDTFEHVAKCKQLLLDYAVNERFDYVMLVDSDLLCEPSTLLSLHSVRVPVVSAVFWTQWTPDQPPLPQCWLSHPYDLNGLGLDWPTYRRLLRQHRVVRVAGGGACTLIDTKVLSRLHYHPRLELPHEGLWRGEDRTFAILAREAHVRQHADAWPRVFHAYSPALRKPEVLQAEWQALNAPRQLYAKPGDWVSVTLTACEDAGLEKTMQGVPEARCVRGRMGGLPIASELQAALTDMTVGDRRIVDVEFEEGHMVYQQPCHKLVQMELVDVRPHG